MTAKKSNFYHVRWHKLGLNEALTAQLLEIDIETIKLWDITGAPIYVEKLLLLWDRKNVNMQGWQGWYFSRGTLHFKKQQWRPENILNDRQFRESLILESNQLLNQVFK